MIKIVKGDLLHAKENIIAHQVNCMGKMNAGVAKQIREAYPVVYDEYMTLVRETMEGEDLRETLLGNVQGITINNGLYIANLFGQYNYGNDNKVYTNVGALYKCFKTVRKVAEINGYSVAMPYMIGCYRGGADWKVVEDMMLTAFDGYEVTLYKKHMG